MSLKSSIQVSLSGKSEWHFRTITLIASWRINWDWIIGKIQGRYFVIGGRGLYLKQREVTPAQRTTKIN